MGTDAEGSQEQLRERRKRLRALRQRARRSGAAAGTGSSPKAKVARADAADPATGAPVSGPAQRFLAGLSGEAAQAGDAKPGDAGDAGPFSGPAQRFWAALSGEPGQSVKGGGAPAVAPQRGGVAGMLLTMLRTRTDPSTPTIPGTSFTEEGVATLLDRLQGYTAPLGPGQGGLAKLLHRFLTARPPVGVELVAGANVANLRFLESFLGGAQTPAPAPAPAGRGGARTAAREDTDEVELLRSKVAELSGTIEKLTKRLDAVSSRSDEPAARSGKAAAVRARPAAKTSAKAPAGVQSDKTAKQGGQAKAAAAKRRASRRPAAPRRRKS